MREIRTILRYRLLQRPPLTVAFPSVTYRLEIRPVVGAPQWTLDADGGHGFPRWSLCRSSENREILELCVFETGFEIRRPTAASLILDRLCACGLAEIVWPEHERTDRARKSSPGSGSGPGQFYRAESGASHSLTIFTKPM